MKKPLAVRREWLGKKLTWSIWHCVGIVVSLDEGKDNESSKTSSYLYWTPCLTFSALSQWLHQNFFWSKRTPLLKIAELHCRNRSDKNFQVDHTLTVVSQAIAKFCDRYVWHPSLEIAWERTMHIKRERGWGLWGQAKLHNINQRTAMITGSSTWSWFNTARESDSSGIWCEALIRLLIIYPTNVCNDGWSYQH